MQTSASGATQLRYYSAPLDQVLLTVVQDSVSDKVLSAEL